MALIIAICFFGNACTAYRTMRSSFHQPTATSEKIPLKIALLSNEKFPPKRLRVGSRHGYYVNMETSPGIMNAVQAELSALFNRVTVVRSATESSSEDLVVMAELLTRYTSEKPGSKVGIGLTFKDPDSGKTIVKFERQEKLPRLISATSAWLPAVPPFYFTLPLYTMSFGSRTQKFTEKAISGSLRMIAADIRKDRKLVEYVQGQSRARQAEKEGDAAKRSGNGEEAFDRYAAALKEAALGSKISRRVRKKFLGLVASVDLLPEVPEEAQRHSNRAQAYLKQAEGIEDYNNAIVEFEKALLLAPWWAEAYFNVGLVQEKAKKFSAAIENMKFYLLAAPHAEDASEVKMKIDELEVAKQRAGK